MTNAFQIVTQGGFYFQDQMKNTSVVLSLEGNKEKVVVTRVVQNGAIVSRDYVIPLCMLIV